VARPRSFTRRSTPALKTWRGQATPGFGTDVSGVLGAFSPGLKVFGTPFPEDETVLRTRGLLAATSGSLNFGDLVLLALGIGLCTTEAALAGAVPLPFDNPDWDGWFVYQTMHITARSPITDPGSSESMIIDSKAMRKIPAGQVLFFSTQLFTAGGSGGNSVSEAIQVRALLKTS